MRIYFSIRHHLDFMGFVFALTNSWRCRGGALAALATPRRPAVSTSFGKREQQLNIHRLVRGCSCEWPRHGRPVPVLPRCFRCFRCSPAADHAYACPGLPLGHAQVVRLPPPCQEGGPGLPGRAWLQPGPPATQPAAQHVAQTLKASGHNFIICRAF